MDPGTRSEGSRAPVSEPMKLFRDVVPKDVTVNFEFDESPTVIQAVKSVEIGDGLDLARRRGSAAHAATVLGWAQPQQ